MQKALNERDYQIAELKSWKIKALQRINLLEDQMRYFQVKTDEHHLHTDWMVQSLTILHLSFSGTRARDGYLKL
jgi:hypothetical protein